MMFFTTLVVIVGISLTSARPAEVDPQQQFQKELLKAMKPVQTEVRSMAANARSAAEDMTKAVGEAGANLIKAGQEFIKPDGLERGNLRDTLNQRIRNLGKAFQDNTRGLIQRALGDVRSIGASDRSAMFGVKDAMQMLETKYLTPDGQDLVNLAMKMLQ